VGYDAGQLIALLLVELEGVAAEVLDCGELLDQPGE
jgi:hypothetical protein